MASAGPLLGPSVSATGINHKVSHGSISEECLAGRRRSAMYKVKAQREGCGERAGGWVADALNRLKLGSLTRSPRKCQLLHYVHVLLIDPNLSESIGSSPRFSIRRRRSALLDTRISFDICFCHARINAHPDSYEKSILIYIFCEMRKRVSWETELKMYRKGIFKI
jgi:hypothetical protein